MAKIIHFRENCIGCNSCAEHADCYWRLTAEDGKADLIGAEEKNGVFIKNISEVEMEPNLRAARDCPVGIIRVYDDKGQDITKE